MFALTNELMFVLIDTTIKKTHVKHEHLFSLIDDTIDEQMFFVIYVFIHE